MGEFNRDCLDRFMMQFRLAMTMVLSVQVGAVCGAEQTREGDRALSSRWALNPVRVVASPGYSTQGDSSKSLHPIDVFVLSGLQARGLTGSPPADRATLIRRLSFDLIGLPPTPEEIDAFVADASPDAYTRLVDRLLASARYGERWARHWLDIARYTESDGFERDQIRENAWHYRDYVIKAFNDDKPYDRFVSEQIAGDVLEPVTSDGIVATSFLVCGSYDRVGANQQSEVMRTLVREDELEGVIGTVSQAFLGLTLHCARCHDHKYDPIPTEDYYRFKSVFDGVWHGERAILSPDDEAARRQQLSELRTLRAALQREVSTIEGVVRNALSGERPAESINVIGVPTPVARWEFDGDARDDIGSAHGALRGDAKIEGGRLILDGKQAYVETAPLPFDLREKTLEVWVELGRLKQRGGGALTVESMTGGVFDSIVFGEREPRRWIAGSNNFVRTRNLGAPLESGDGEALIHLAIVYSEDHRIAVYRNGEPYGKSYQPNGVADGAKPGLQTYRSGASRVLIGRRHTGGANTFLAGAIERAVVYDRALTAKQVAASYNTNGPHIPRAELLAAMSDDQRRRYNALIRELDDNQDDMDIVGTTPTSYAGVRKQPEPTRVLDRGDARRPGEVVAPAGLSAIASPSPVFGLAPDAPEGERRLELARWITDPANPLTARAMVNRLWHHHFGVGLVDTPSDLGGAGKGPSHPGLLDYLADAFVRSGWSIKHMHRLMVTSSTYRQVSTGNARAASIDWDNRWLWRYAPRRLEGEVVRDALLALSGRLNLEMGGPGFRPFDIVINNAHHYVLKDVDEPGMNRRSIYRINVNSGKSTVLDAFDCPDPSVNTPSRRVTTTPMQALSLMNNSFVIRQADYFAERVMGESGGGLEGAIGLAYRYALGRCPTKTEAGRAALLAETHGLSQVCWALMNASEFLYVR